MRHGPCRLEEVGWSSCSRLDSDRSSQGPQPFLRPWVPPPHPESGLWEPQGEYQDPSFSESSADGEQGQGAGERLAHVDPAAVLQAPGRPHPSRAAELPEAAAPLCAAS